MEKLKLNNGKVIDCAVKKYKGCTYYLCANINDAVDLKMTLTDIGNKCEVIPYNKAFFVKVDNN